MTQFQEYTPSRDRSWEQAPPSTGPEGPGNRREAPPTPQAGLGEECATARPVLHASAGSTLRDRGGGRRREDLRPGSSERGGNSTGQYPIADVQLTFDHSYIARRHRVLMKYRSGAQTGEGKPRSDQSERGWATALGTFLTVSAHDSTNWDDFGRMPSRGLQESDRHDDRRSYLPKEASPAELSEENNRRSTRGAQSKSSMGMVRMMRENH